MGTKAPAGHWVQPKPEAATSLRPAGQDEHTRFVENVGAVEVYCPALQTAMEAQVRSVV